MNNKFVRKVGYIIRTPSLILSLIGNVKRQHRFLRVKLGPLLDEAEKNSDGTLDPSDFKKIYTYYGLAVPAILGEEIAALRGKPMTERERLALSYQGAMTGLFDDFFDRHDMPEEQLLSFINDPSALQGNNSSERLFLVLFREALKLSHHPQLTIHFLRKVYHAQVDSKKQAQPGLAKDEIRRITVDKGGVSVLFYRSVFEHKLGKQEEEALYKMGGLMQFGNDIFDVYKDSLQDIETLMTTTKKVGNVRLMFREMQKESFHSFYQTTYRPRDIRRFLRLVSLSLCARCYVCFDQLEQVEKKNGGVFTPKFYSRQDLVCDLDKPGNKWSSVRYHIWEDLEYIR